MSIGCLTKAQGGDVIKKFKLNGHLAGRDTGAIYLAYVNSNGKLVKDTAQVKAGRFTFNGAVNEPTDVIITGNVRSRSVNDPNMAEFFLEPGQVNISLEENNFKKAVVTGSRTQQEQEILNKEKGVINDQIEPLNKELAIINKALAQRQTDELETKRTGLLKKFIPFQQAIKKIDIEFIAAHPGSYLSPSLLYYYFSNNKLTTDSAKTFFDNLSGEVKKSRAALDLSNLIIAHIATNVGRRAPGFSKISVDNKQVNLEEFIKKGYVLLDFWASWCAPCREEGPQIDSLYKKYKSKGLSLIGISLDTDNKAWKDAIAKDNIAAWNHIVLDMRNADVIRDQYYIGAIPLLILIDPQGIIAGKYLGFEQEGNINDLARDLERIYKQ